jgi:hypothetical protein
MSTSCRVVLPDVESVFLHSLWQNVFDPTVFSIVLCYCPTFKTAVQYIRHMNPRLRYFLLITSPLFFERPPDQTYHQVNRNPYLGSILSNDKPLHSKSQ